MMKRIVSVLMCLLLAAGMVATAEEAAQADTTTGTPWMDPDVLGNVTEDTSTDLKDNFALYENKDKILTTELSAGLPIAGSGVNGQLQALYDVVGMYMQEAPEEHDALLAYNLYWMLMDWDSRNAVGAAPLKQLTDQVEALSSIDEMSEYLLQTPTEQQLHSAWQLSITINPNDSTSVVLAVAPKSLMLVDAGEYAQETELGALTRQAESQLAQKLLVKLGYTEEEATAKIQNCLAFEGMLASAMHPDSFKKSPEYAASVNNFFSREEMKELQGSLPILEAFSAAGYPEMDQYIVIEPEYIRKLNELWTDENLQLIKDCFIVRGSAAFASRLDRECYDWIQESNNMKNGTPGAVQPDEMIFSAMVSRLLQWPVAQLYTQTYLKPEDKERIAGMVEEIQQAYHGILNEADWLSEETRAKAIEKLDTIQKNVLYPDNWEPYSCEELNFAGPQEGGSLWEALMAIDRYTEKQMVEQINKPLDHSEWPDASTPHTYNYKPLDHSEWPDASTPHTYNCFYLPSFNAIYILGAYVRPLGDLGAVSDEELYAKLGTAIGHEFSHAFDPTGAQYDKDGNMNLWWTEEDGMAFYEKTAKMVAFYDGIQPWKGLSCHGNIVSGEACADLAGMKVILSIAAGKEGFDYDAFFRAYADNYMSVMTPEYARQLLEDQHPLNYLRINIVLQHFDEFLNLYDIHEGDGMYLAPEDRVAIW